MNDSTRLLAKDSCFFFFDSLVAKLVQKSTRQVKHACRGRHVGDSSALLPARGSHVELTKKVYQTILDTLVCRLSRRVPVSSSLKLYY